MLLHVSADQHGPLPRQKSVIYSHARPAELEQAVSQRLGVRFTQLIAQSTQRADQYRSVFNIFRVGQTSDELGEV
jgi:hypothetical protein